MFVSELVTLPSSVESRSARIRNWVILMGEIPFSSFKLNVKLVRLRWEMYHLNKCSWI